EQMPVATKPSRPSWRDKLGRDVALDLFSVEPSVTGSLSLDPPECGVRIHLAILDELDRSQAIGIQDSGKLLYSCGVTVNSVRLRIPPHEDVHEAGRMLRFLPDLIPQRAGLVGPHVGHELVDSVQAFLERFWA